MPEGRVSIAKVEAVYHPSPPFSPDEAAPEYPFAGETLSEAPNPGYRAVRTALHLLGLDAARYGTRAWNPLGGMIRPGDTVVLKPNFVRDFHETQPEHSHCLITHGSIIRAVLDYVYIALRGRGRIVIADAPQNDADFAAIRRMAGLDVMQDFYKRRAGFAVEVYDLRPQRAVKIDGVIVGHEPLAGDPAGYVKVNLGRFSALAEIDHLCDRLYGSEYDTSEVRRHHRGDVHEYLICKTILEADCLIGLPKLKTHKKVGLTVNLKNLVGINGNKNWLPHHREGTPAEGGDQFAESGLKQRVEHRVLRAFKSIFPHLGPLRGPIAAPIKTAGKWAFGDTNAGTIRSGNWHGNDTAWRMAIDLGRIALYADSDGRLRDKPVRRYLAIVDGIIAGEGDGPLAPHPRPAGVVLAGLEPAAVDLVCARLVGFDFRKIPLIRRAFEEHPYPISSVRPGEIECVCNDASWTGKAVELVPMAPPFEPHVGWRGAVERVPPAPADSAKDAS